MKQDNVGILEKSPNGDLLLIVRQEPDALNKTSDSLP